ncbi:MAG: sortase, partial [Acidimicrobiales bacterium]
MPQSADDSRQRATRGYEFPPVPPPVASPEPSTSSRMGSVFTRILGTLGRFFISTGVIILLFVAYQLWGTGIQEAQAQDNLRSQFENVLEEATLLVPEFEPAIATTTTVEPAPDTAEPEVVPDKIVPAISTTTTIPKEFLELLFPEGGEEVARLQIPVIDVDKIVVEGVQVSDLRKGPGHYASTAIPGESGNAAIAGHRTTYGAPFHNIDQLVPGDEIVVTNVLGRFVYEVIGQAESDRIGF